MIFMIRIETDSFDPHYTAFALLSTTFVLANYRANRQYLP